MENQRRFNRITFTNPTSLQINGELFPTELVDLSLQGALIKNINNDDITLEQVCSLNFKLDNSDVVLDMQGKIAHIEVETIGIKFDKIDINSVSHLKRLIELNVGEEDLLHRDLENLGN